MTGVNYHSQDALAIVTSLTTGAGAEPPASAATAWRSMQRALESADAEFQQVLRNAEVGWKGEAADAAVARLSPFKGWADAAGAAASGLEGGAQTYGSGWETAKNKVPSEAEVLAARANQMYTKAMIVGPPNPLTLGAAEKADLIVAKQNAEAAAAMATYQATVDAGVTAVEFDASPELTAGTSGGSGNRSGHSATYDNMGGGAVSGYSASTSTQSAYTGPVASGATGGGTEVAGGQQQYTPGQAGSTAPAGGPGAATGSAGYATPTGGAAAGKSGGAATPSAGRHSAGGVNPVTGGSTPGSAADGAGSRRGGVSTSTEGAAGVSGAGRGAAASGGLAGSGLTTGEALAAGGALGGRGRGARGGSGGGGLGGGGESGRSGGSERSGSGRSGFDGGEKFPSEAGGARGAGAGGRGAGSGYGGGPGAGRGQGRDDENEHETPGYLKDFEYFEDGRVIPPPVIGA